MSRELEVPWEEEYVLANDKAQALRKLLPTSEDYYFYHILHDLTTHGDLTSASFSLWERYEKDYSYSQRFRMLKQRLQVLRADSRVKAQKPLPDTDIKALESIFGVHVSTTPPTMVSIGDVAEEQGQYPSTLDNKLLEAFWEGQLREVKPFAVSQFLKKNKPKDSDMVIYAAQHEEHCDFVVSKLCSALSKSTSRDAVLPYLGTLCQRLTLAELDQVKKSHSSVLENAAFVEAYMNKLCPEKLSFHDPAFGERVQSLLKFVKTLPSRFAMLHLVISYHLLVWYQHGDRMSSKEAQALFIEYVAYPRSHLSNKKYMKGRLSIFDHHNVVSLKSLMPPSSHDDQEIIRAYLMAHYMRHPDAWKNRKPLAPFDQYFEETFLQRVAAEGALLGGGDEIKWCSYLPASSVQELKERVQLSFLPHNPTFYEVDDLVQLDVQLKCVTQVISKVFEINTTSYYRQYQQEIDTSIDLDGLIARDEQILTLPATSPLEVTRQRFEFPSINKRGVYVIELIGNGISSRALIRKGQLQYVDSPTPQGHLFHIFNETQQLEPHSTLYLDGVPYHANEKGEILVPFAREASPTKIVLSSSSDDFSCLSSCSRITESYTLRCGISVDRESLLSGQTSHVLIHPRLILCDSHPVPWSTFKSLQVTITASVAGSSQEHTLTETKLDTSSTTGSYDVSFSVPPSLTSVQVIVRGSLVCANGETMTVQRQRTCHVNLDRTSTEIVSCFLRAHEGAYQLALLGKNGEPQKGITVRVCVHHAAFTNTHHFILESDAQGLIHLGALNDITRVAVDGVAEKYIHKSWNLHPHSRVDIPSLIHAFTEEEIRIPLSSQFAKCSPPRVVQWKNGHVLRDYALVVEVKNQQVVIPAGRLPPGSYQVKWNFQSTPTQIEMLDRKTVQPLGDWFLTKDRFFTHHESSTKPVSITRVRTSSSSRQDRLSIQLAHATPSTVVHVIASPLLPAFDPYSQLEDILFASPLSVTSHFPSSTYTSGRELGDEYRYIIDRKYVTHYPHLLLSKPTLLSNPWARAEVHDSQGFAATGDDFAKQGDAMARSMVGRTRQRQTAEDREDSSCLDFLASPSVILSNLQPDANGRVRVPYETLCPQGQQHIQVIVCDQHTLTSLNVLAPAPSVSQAPWTLVDLRLKNTLQFGENYIEKEQISVLSGATSLTFQEGVSEEHFEVYASLKSLFSFFSSRCTPSQREELSPFEFLLTWPQLSEKNKRKQYARYACHEVHFFLLHQDEEFFKSVALPHIELKRHKTFLDYYFMGARDVMQTFLVPWRLQSLNLLERILLASTCHVDELAKNIIHECLYQDLLDIQAQKDAAMKLHDVSSSTRRIIRSPGGSPRFRKFGKRRLSTSYRRTSICMDLSDLASLRLSGPPSPVYSCASPDSCSLADSMDEYLEDDTEEEEEVEKEKTPVSVLKTENTQEFEEQSYYHKTRGAQSPLIKPARFWADYMRWLQEKQKQGGDAPVLPFLSRNFAHVGLDVSSILFALTVTALPHESAAPQIKYTPAGLIASITAPATPLIVRYKELVNVSLSTTSNTEALSVVQCIFRKGSEEKFLSDSDDFLPGCVYTSRNVIMNSSKESKQVEVLFQIPQGSIPLQGMKPTSFVEYTVGAYSTQIYEVEYYFPSCGTFQQYPPQLSLEGTPMVTADPRVFTVVHRLRNVERNWPYVCRFGSDQEILDQLKNLNVAEQSLGLLTWRLSPLALFQQVIEVLRTRHIFHREIWAWSFRHKDVQGMKEYMESKENIQSFCGPYIETTLLTVHPKERGIYQHREYDPLVDARAHLFGARRKLLNDGVRTQYISFLKLLCYKPTLASEDRLELCYFLLLMNRQEEAVRLFAMVNWTQADVSSLDQYFIAYMQLLRGNLSAAQTIALRFLESPVLRVRERFEELNKQIEEAKNATIVVEDQTSRVHKKTRTLSFVVQDKALVLDYQNMEEVRIAYYLMDIEFLFSSNPFMGQQSSHLGQFSHTKPNHVESVSLPADLLSYQVSIPERYNSQNIMIEISGHGIHCSSPYFAHSMRVHFSSSQGRLQVTTRENKPLPTTYVKVYSRATTQASGSFYKDGYTDHRGVFDYRFLTTPKQVSHYSILLISKDHGSVIHELSA